MLPSLSGLISYFTWSTVVVGLSLGTLSSFYVLLLSTVVKFGFGRFARSGGLDPCLLATFPLAACSLPSGSTLAPPYSYRHPAACPLPLGALTALPPFLGFNGNISTVVTAYTTTGAPTVTTTVPLTVVPPKMPVGTSGATVNVTTITITV